eukprot:COSAG01_NODE_399_length_17543_cov_15.077792_5_plen_127_part_00
MPSINITPMAPSRGWILCGPRTCETFYVAALTAAAAAAAFAAAAGEHQDLASEQASRVAAMTATLTQEVARFFSNTERGHDSCPPRTGSMSCGCWMAKHHPRALVIRLRTLGRLRFTCVLRDRWQH